MPAPSTTPKSRASPLHFRPRGVRTVVSVEFGSPQKFGDLDTFDPRVAANVIAHAADDNAVNFRDAGEYPPPTGSASPTLSLTRAGRATTSPRPTFTATEDSPGIPTSEIQLSSWRTVESYTEHHVAAVAKRYQSLQSLPGRPTALRSGKIAIQRIIDLHCDGTVRASINAIATFTPSSNTRQDSRWCGTTP
jgi:hypothetical protein